MTVEKIVTLKLITGVYCLATTLLCFIIGVPTQWAIYEPAAIIYNPRLIFFFLIPLVLGTATAVTEKRYFGKVTVFFVATYTLLTYLRGQELIPLLPFSLGLLAFLGYPIVAVGLLVEAFMELRGK